MTKRHEVESLIELAENIMDDLLYEANTRPGDGPEFQQLLLAARSMIEHGAHYMKEAADMLPQNEPEASSD
jgi:hypothetical protein